MGLFQATVRLYIFLFLAFSLASCTSTQLRMPSSQYEVYTNTELRNSLKLAASNGILFHLPTDTLQAYEKSEIDPQCKDREAPLWSEKMSVYLNYFKQHPELYSKFHIFEIKQGDRKKIDMQKDLIDGGMTLSIQYEKGESRGPVTLNSKMPCENVSRAEYIGKMITKTFYDFPSNEDLQAVLAAAPEKANIDRFKFPNDFFVYLADRGIIFKFDHDKSFEKYAENKYVFAEVVRRLSAEVKTLSDENHFGLWVKKINQNSDQAGLIQLFAIEKNRDQKTGIKVDSQGELHRKNSGDKDLTYIFSTYKVENEIVYVVGLSEVNKCLQKLTSEMGPFKFRQPADAKDRDSYLYPGYECKL
jgi:hypothetical protein